MKSARLPARGFTLIELAVVMAILAIAATMAAPSMRDFIIRNNTNAAASEFQLGLLRTRNAAVTRNMCVAMCRSTTTQAVLPDLPVCAGAGADWKDGWLIFQNTDCDATVTDPAAIDLIAIGSPLSAEFSLTFSASNAATPTGYILVDAEGRPRGSDVGGFDLRYRTETRASNRRICWNLLGSITVIGFEEACSL